MIDFFLGLKNKLIWILSSALLVLFAALKWYISQNKKLETKVENAEFKAKATQEQAKFKDEALSEESQNIKEEVKKADEAIKESSESKSDTIDKW